jgi:DNA end-binding protein Ku
MRAIWKGAVSFGLVSIAVKLYSATEEKSIRFHQVHREDGGRIRYQRVCAVCGAQVEYDDIAKGYDLGGGEIVVLTDEDFADLPLSTSRAIDVLEFVPAAQIDPILFNKAYYLEPEGTATKPYVLLRDALSDSERVAIVKIALRQREQLATLRVREGVLVLNTMLWPDEVREPEFSFLDEAVEARGPELAMAASLIDSMTGDFDSVAFTDDYREALQEVIDAKAEGREIEAPAEPEEAPAAVDLMAALRASVERAQAARGGEAEAPPAEPTPITAARSRRSAPVGADSGNGAAGESADRAKRGERAGRPAAKSGGKPAAKAAGKTAATSAGRAGGKAAAKAAGKTAATSAGRAGGKAAKSPAKAKQAAPKPAKKAAAKAPARARKSA